MAVMAQPPAIIEPVAVQDVFASGRVVEDCGPYVRVLFFCDRTIPCTETMERVLVARIVMTKGDYVEAIRSLGTLAFTLVPPEEAAATH